MGWLTTWPQITIAVITTAGTIATVWLTVRASRRKDSQDTLLGQFSAMQKEIGRLRDDQNDRDEQARKYYVERMDMQNEIAELMSEIHTLQFGVRLLHAQIKDLGHSPLWPVEQGEMP